MLGDLWLKALRSKNGVLIETDNRMLLRQHLYRARAELNNPELDSIVIVLPEQANQIWLVHKDASSLGTNHQGHIEPL